MIDTLWWQIGSEVECKDSGQRYTVIRRSFECLQKVFCKDANGVVEVFHQTELTRPHTPSERGFNDMMEAMRRGEKP